MKNKLALNLPTYKRRHAIAPLKKTDEINIAYFYNTHKKIKKRENTL